MALSVEDLSAVLAAAEDLARLDQVADFAPTAVACVRRVVPCDSAGYNEVDPATGTTTLAIDPPVDVPDGAHAAMARYADQHPVIAAHRRGDTRVLRISDFLSTRAFHRLDLYREIYAPMGVEYQMSFTLPAALPLVVGVALNRSDRDFDEDDRSRAELLRPHLEAALLRVRGVPRSFPLTPRQREVAELVAEGLTNAEIAERLCVSPGTIKKHLDLIYARLGVHGRARVAAVVTEARDGSPGSTAGER